MTPTVEPPREATPEDAAVTGGVPPAAEPPPQTRQRRASHAGFAWATVAVGLILVLVGALADQSSGAQAGTIVAGVTLIGASVLTMAGLIHTNLFAALAFLGGIMLAVAAFSAPDFGVAQAVLVAASAVTFLGAFGSLAASRSIAATGAAEEPAPGVRNV